MGNYNISITLDQRPLPGAAEFPTFVPGQTVSGRVYLSLHSQKKVDAVDIIFEGECYTRVTRSSGNNGQRTHHHEKHSLFTLSQRLFSGPYTIQPSNMDWPFSFILPESTTLQRQGHGEGDLRFNPGPQPMPPSTDISTHGHREIKARVSYSLTAKLNPNSLLGTKSSTLPIVVRPISPSGSLPQPCPAIIPIPEQTYRSNSLRPEKHSLKQKMSHIFTSDPSLKTPTINFRPRARLPNSASIDQPLPISLSIERLKTGPTDPEDPTLRLDNVTLCLKQYTTVRVRSLIDNYYDTRSSEVASKSIRVGVKLPLDDRPVQVTDTFKLSDLMLREAQLAMPPSFMTYTINQAYKLKMTVNVSHPETGHIYTFDAKTEFRILPSEKDDNSGGAGADLPPPLIPHPLDSKLAYEQQRYQQQQQQAHEDFAPPPVYSQDPASGSSSHWQEPPPQPYSEKQYPVINQEYKASKESGMY